MATPEFHVRYKCEFGQEVYLVGNCSALGNWDVLEGVQLVWSTGHIWEGAVELPAGLHIQYKYVVRNKDGSVVRWQEGANVSLELPGGPAEALALDVEDSWNKSKQIKRIMAAGTPVRFNIRLKVEFGQQLFVVGSCSSLGGWNIDNAVKLNWQEGHIWEASVELPAGEVVNYKYIVKLTDGTVERWQPGDNLQMEVPVAQGQSGRRRGVLVLDTWSKASSKAAKPRSYNRRSPGASWRSTPYSSVPAGASGVAVHTDSPRFEAGANGLDIEDASTAMAARSYYSMMDPQGQPLVSSAEVAESTAHIREPERQQHDPSLALNSVMVALQHSAELDHWVDDPTDPRMLAADRRLAALTASLGTASGVATAAAMV
eukprot:gene2125-2444_t